jgi:hypothetical protein
MAPKIFLAHAREDKAQVRKLYADLTARGLDPWLDEVDLVAGQIWKEEIPKAIHQAGIFLACLSSRSAGKVGYVQNEFRLALSAFGERPPGSIYLIPVRLDECDVPDLQIPDRGLSLQDIQWVDLWEEGGFDRLVKAIERALEGLVNPRQARGAAIPLAEPRTKDVREELAPEATQEQAVIAEKKKRGAEVKPAPDAFLSYTRFDDRHDGGAISELCRRLASAVQESDGSFWKSLGGIVTGIAAIMTAVGGLIGVWYQWVNPAVGPGRITPPPVVQLSPKQPPGGTADGGMPQPEVIQAARAEPVEASVPRGGEIGIGDAILAEWQGDGCLYPGAVREIKNGRYHIYFSFDEEVWITLEGLVKPIKPMAAAVSPGARVYVEVNDVRTKWVPSLVRDIRDGRYYVIFDADARCRPRDKDHVWAGIDEIVVSH